MAKLSRNELKSIVKECLVEILSEGLADPGTSTLQLESKKPRRQRRQPPSRENQRRPADSIRYENAIKESIGNLTEDQMMASLFEDTARNTLQEQISAESASGPAGPLAEAPGNPGMEQVGDPLNIFGGSKNWEKLAFSNLGEKS